MTLTQYLIVMVFFLGTYFVSLNLIARYFPEKKEVESPQPLDAWHPITPEFLDKKGRLCVACGSAPAMVSLRYKDHCTKCYGELAIKMRTITEAIKEKGRDCAENRGPKYFACFLANGKTLGHGFHLQESPAQAMAQALRMQQSNGWQLLRVDIQHPLTDIYVSKDYAKNFRGTKIKALPYDADKYGPIPTLWNIPPIDEDTHGPLSTPVAKSC